MNIYVGNLSYTASESELRDAFSAFGDVTSVKILMDRETGRSRGFGFVEMPNQSEGEAAISNLNGKDLGGRAPRGHEGPPRARAPLIRHCRFDRSGLGLRATFCGARPATMSIATPRRYNRVEDYNKRRSAPLIYMKWTPSDLATLETPALYTEADEDGWVQREFALGAAGGVCP